MTDTTAEAVQGAALEFPLDRDPKCPFNPPERLVRCASETPVVPARIWDDSTPWLFTGQEEIRSIVADPRVSVNDRLPGYPHWNEGMAATAHERPDSFTTLDGAAHMRLRRMATKSFSFKRVEALRAKIEHIVDEQLEAMLSGPKPADLVEKLALPLPSKMICELLGVPYEDHTFIEEAAVVSLDRNISAEVQKKTLGGLFAYMAKIISEKSVDSGEQSVTADYAGYVATGDLTLPEAVMMCNALLFAGHETSANMIGLGVLAALRNPEQLAILRDSDDPKVIAGAVEELLRYLSIIHNGQRRIAVGDFEVGGQQIKAGDGIILDYSAANWDSRSTEHPDRLDLLRTGNDHLAFGFGPHSCIGQQLARAELQIVFGTIFKKMPTLELAIPFEEVDFKYDRLAFGVYSLPVTW